MCQHRSPRVGVCGDVLAWHQAGIEPARAVRALGRRLLVLRLNQPSSVGARRAIADLLMEIKRRDIQPVFTFPYSQPGPELTRRLDTFDKTALKLVSEP